MEDKFEETSRTWNKVAQPYEDKFLDYALYDETYNSFCKSVEIKNASILEIGCGPGNITKKLLSNRPDFSVYGIDIAPKMIKLAKKNNPTAKFDVMNSKHIHELDLVFDAVVCGFCIPYVSSPDCEKLIKNTYALLSENGVFYLSFVEGNPKDSGFKAGSDGNRLYFYYYSLKEIKSKLIDSKFKEIKVFKLDYRKSEWETETHVVLIARKKPTFKV